MIFDTVITAPIGGIGGLLTSVERQSVWRLAPAVRGEAIEKALGSNLPRFFKTFDRFADRVATSIKSIDLRAATYQRASALKSLLNRYVNDAANFTEYELELEHVSLQAKDILTRELEIAIPRSGPSALQQSVIDQVTRGALERGVNLRIIPFP